MLKLIKACLPVALATLTLSSAASAAPGVIDGRDARSNLDSLTRQVYWFGNLRDAEDSARTKAKPLLWVHILGKIDGAT